MDSGPYIQYDAVIREKFHREGEKTAMKKIIRSAFLFLMLCACAGEGASLAETAPDAVKIINHRGYNTAAPENTLPAYELSAEMGYSLVETDVCFTKDLVPVLLHDATINRTARNADGSPVKGSVRIGDITYEEALAYDFGVWKGAEYAGTRIPTFDSFLSLCRERGLQPYIELKENGNYGREEISGLLDMVREYGMERQVTWISFNAGYLEWIRDRDPEARLGYLAAFWLTKGDFGGILRRAEGLRTGSNEVFLDVSIQMLSYALGGADRYIQMSREAGIPVEVWTVDSGETVRALNPYITGVTTNSLPADILRGGK